LPPRNARWTKRNSPPGASHVLSATRNAPLPISPIPFPPPNGGFHPSTAPSRERTAPESPVAIPLGKPTVPSLQPTVPFPFRIDPFTECPLFSVSYNAVSDCSGVPTRYVHNLLAVASLVTWDACVRSGGRGLINLTHSGRHRPLTMPPNRPKGRGGGGACPGCPLGDG
jgi:hypothetical protein